MRVAQTRCHWWFVAVIALRDSRHGGCGVVMMLEDAAQPEVWHRSKTAITKSGVAVPLIFRVATSSDTKNPLKQHKRRGLWKMPVRQALEAVQSGADLEDSGGPQPRGRGSVQGGRGKRSRLDSDGDVIMVCPPAACVRMSCRQGCRQGAVVTHCMLVAVRARWDWGSSELSNCGAMWAAPSPWRRRPPELGGWTTVIAHKRDVLDLCFGGVLPEKRRWHRSPARDRATLREARIRLFWLQPGVGDTLGDGRSPC